MLKEHSFPYSHIGPFEEVIVQRIMSVSFTAALPNDEKNAVRTRVWAVIKETPELAQKEMVSFSYQTLVYCCKKM